VSNPGMSGAFDGDIQTATVEQIGKASAKLGEIADELTRAREAGTADRIESLAQEQAKQAGILTELKTKHDTEVADAAAKAQSAAVSELLEWGKTVREPSKAAVLGGFGPQQKPQRQFDVDTKGAFLYGVHEANARDTSGRPRARRSSPRSVARRLGPRASTARARLSSTTSWEPSGRTRRRTVVRRRGASRPSARPMPSAAGSSPTRSSTSSSPRPGGQHLPRPHDGRSGRHRLRGRHPVPLRGSDARGHRRCSARPRRTWTSRTTATRPPCTRWPASTTSATSSCASRAGLPSAMSCPSSPPRSRRASRTTSARARARPSRSATRRR
jgi:hypothetical protein